MKLTGNILTLILSSFLLMLPAGCIKEDFAVDCAEQGKEVTLQISISQSALTKASSATGSTTTDLEKDIKSLRIFAFYKGAAAGHLHIPDVSVYENATGGWNFYMDLKMFLIGKQKFDFYVIANEASIYGLSHTLNENSTENDLNRMGFTSIVGVHDATAANGPVTFPNGMVNVAKQSYIIEMTNDHVANNAAGHENHSLVNAVYDANGTQITDNVLSFDLERPVGKLCVFAAKAPGSDENVNLTVSAIRLLQAGTRRYNYLMPQSTATLKAMQLTYENTVNLHLSEEPAAGSNSTGGSVNVTKILNTPRSTNEADYDCVLLHDYYPHENAYGASPATWDQPVYYTPGVDTDGKKTWTISEDQPASVAAYRGNIMEIDYYFGDDVTTKKTGTVYLPPIERNHYYGVYCSMKSDGGISITYNVMAWDNVQENWIFTYNYPDYVDLYPVETTTNANGDLVYVYPAAGPTVSYSSDESGCFKARFKIWGPVGCQWSPILEVKNVGEGKNETTASTTDYEYEVYEIVNGIKEPRTGATFGESNNEYEIHVRAKKSDNVGAYIKLGISFIPAWEDTHILLMVNGAEVNQCAWPNSGIYPEWIEIKQVDRTSIINQ